ncbi:MAG: ribbon-helix-helix protein, CopG family [Armatimonadetes bacterium]|nr:ribbon-helix-helix protein, CopG family [Armatimonadota bacterium]
MKTAVSVPDELYAEAERLARARGITRSSLYQEALRDYLQRERDDRMTEAINLVVDQIAEHGDDDDTGPFVRAAAAATLRRVEW